MDLNWPGTKLLLLPPAPNTGGNGEESELGRDKFKIVTERELADLHALVQKCSNNIGARLPTKFPGTQPISFQSEHLAWVSEPQAYLVCEKSDGQRYLMLFAQNACYLVNTKMEFFLVDEDLAKYESVNNTLVDGELVKDCHQEEGGKTEINFYIFDALCFTGMPVLNHNLQERLRLVLARDLLSRCPTPQLHSFKLKRMFLASASRYLLSQKLLHESDGLIFTRLQAPYVASRSDTILKWKPAEMNTADFAICKTSVGSGEERYAAMYWQERGQLKIFPHQRYIHLTPEEHALFLRAAAELGKQGKTGEQSALICECSFDANWPIPRVDKAQSWNEVELSSGGDGAWRFMRFRHDKHLPNAKQTVESVMHSIAHPVTSEMLLQAVE